MTALPLSLLPAASFGVEVTSNVVAKGAKNVQYRNAVRGNSFGLLVVENAILCAAQRGAIWLNSRWKRAKTDQQCPNAAE